ncbi:hypothetical protein OPV22_014731 [Ensete ventricosum]|uniref:Uncharacterized protein n=1 Tax=Ensete ventricosum TaxID=4639 RepID=A0AAV8R894_ENSVE|nr:hypothetical protein OPV22_014731 [Ensete ventricosum]
MAVALMKPRAPAGRAMGFLPLLFDTIYVSAVPSPSSMNAEDPKKKKNLFGVAQFLPNWGIGYKMAKTHWRDVSYEISKVNLDKDGRHGKARGIWYKAGFTSCRCFCWVKKTPKADYFYSPSSKCFFLKSG